jgi:hypothetical protein
MQNSLASLLFVVIVFSEEPQGLNRDVYWRIAFNTNSTFYERKAPLQILLAEVLV